MHFHFQITYRPGSKNGEANVLSHCYTASKAMEVLQPIVPSSLMVEPVSWDLDSEIAYEMWRYTTPQGLVYVPKRRTPV